MMRTRLIRPGFFENEALAELAPYARLLFAGLWLMADRAGRLKDQPVVIRATIFPYETVDVDAYLSDLARAGFIRRYVGSGGERCVEVVHFSHHQHPHVHEAESKLPAPRESAKNRRKNAKPVQCRGDALTKSVLRPVDSYSYADTDTDADTAGPGIVSAPPGLSRYVTLAAQALQQTLHDHHTDNVGLVTERFKALCIEQDMSCDVALAAQAVEAALMTRAQKATQLLEAMRPRRRA